MNYNKEHTDSEKQNPIDNAGLPYPLDEFKIALEDEIEVSKRNASNNAIPLSNGHKVGTQGFGHQYAFMIDSVLNTPDGAPGDLMIKGKPPMSATIVSVDGLRIVISVETDLGKFVPDAKLQTNLAFLMRKLVDRIESHASEDNPAAKRMLGIAPSTGTPSTPNVQLYLNEGQLEALKNALGRDHTVIWGPPGTGKTHTIGTISEYLHRRSRTVLVVSHTNIAVDQAMKHIAEALKKEISDGAIIRVGKVKDSKLASSYPEILLETQVKRQSEELIREREKIADQRQSLSGELIQLQKTISISTWLDYSKQEIDLVENAIEDLENLQIKEQNDKAKVKELGEKHSELRNIHQISAKILSVRKELLAHQEKQQKIESAYESTANKRDELSRKVEEQDKRIEIANRIGRLRTERDRYPSLSEQEKTISQLTEKGTKLERNISAQQNELQEAQFILKEARNTGAIGRAFRKLPKPKEQENVVYKLRNNIETLRHRIQATQTALKAATSKLASIVEMDEELKRHEGVGSSEDECMVRDETMVKLDEISLKFGELDNFWSNITSKINQRQKEMQKLSQEISGDPKEVYIDVCNKLKEFKELQTRIDTYKGQKKELQKKIDLSFSRIIAKMEGDIEFGERPSSNNKCLNKVHVVHSKLLAKYSSENLVQLEERAAELKTKERKLSRQIDSIDERISAIENDIICNASIIGTTLTKTYLSDNIQSRKFDTVILDEASMAPIPALWIAARLAEQNLVIVGDFNQLSPIVLSDNQFSLKWLGRDIFDVSGMTDKWKSGTHPPNFVPLTEQRRMLPDISSIANLFYDGILRNKYIHAEEYNDYEDFKKWYSLDWKYDNTVTLIDTKDMNAWVTSVPKGGHCSRLNFLSASISIDISQQLLSEERDSNKQESHNRILIVSPYNSHAKLVNLMLKDEPDIQDDVVAGTVHSFQGKEADVVIFDLVVDDPARRANIFTPRLDDEIKRLLNVALTRSKFRLIILGDFDHCKTCGKKAYLGKEFLPFLLQKFPRIDARKVVPYGIAARAAEAQMATLGGRIDPNSERIIVTHSNFYKLLAYDLQNAIYRVIIYSPFMTLNRLSDLFPQLQQAIEKGIQIYVFTKDPSERRRKELENVKKIEKQLSRMGVKIIHKYHMHEKLIFIDDDITWAGSLNPLSYSNTQEIMERRKSQDLLKDYFKILRLEQIIEVKDCSEQICPVCGAEMALAESGPRSSCPNYWRCLNKECHYTRSLDQPYPHNGILSCAHDGCNGSVEFGYWGNYPHWRCTANPKHRQKIYKSHFRLPKMAAKVPPDETENLCRLLNIDNLDDYALTPNEGPSTSQERFAF